jgi:hypothetical protein
MAQSVTQKQSDFVARYSNAVVALIAARNALADLNAEWSANGYATGAPEVQGVGWNIPDSVVQLQLPACTAAMINSAVGATTSVIATVDSNMGYLIVLRP